MDLTKREKIGTAVFIVVILTILSINYFKNNNKNTVEVIDSKEKKQSVQDVKLNANSKNEICVYISGEINKPGVYKLSEGDRIDTLVNMAGGFTSGADISAINLAMKLKDEDYVFVRSKVEVNAQTQPGLNTSPQISFNDKININTATADQLKTLSGIGDTLAQRIIDYRTSNGFFKDISDIKNVSGIGDAKFNSIKDKITVH